MTTCSRRTLLTGASISLAASPLLDRSVLAADPVAEARAAVVRYAGPQTVWTGPTSAPKPELGRTIVYLSGDEQNDISHLYGVYMGQAARRIGWNYSVIDGKGSPATWVAGFNQAIALKPQGIAIFADAKSLQGPIQTAVGKGIKVVGLHAASLPGPQPDLHLFVNIEEDARAIGHAQADWVISQSDGHARVVIVTHNEYEIAQTKSDATRARLEACPGVKVVDYVNFPASAAAQRMPQLTTSWVQRFGLPLYVTSVGDNDFDFAVPALRSAGVKPKDANLTGSDGNRSAYARIRTGEYQTATVAEPIGLQAYQAVDELNRAIQNAPPSGFVQPPYLVTRANVDREGGKQDTFIPDNHYIEHYLAIWGVKS
ncbi:MAG: substrate-binding domain-containing protein [Acetobacteraceae bacterium]